MKAIILLLFLSPCAVAQLLKLNTLKTVDGKVYESVMVTEKREDGISISHSAGTARIAYERLHWTIRKKLGGFDAKAAALAREEDARRVAKNEAFMARAVAEMDKSGSTQPVIRRQAKRVIANRDKMTVKPVIYGGRKCLQISVQAAEPGLRIVWGSGSRDFEPWEAGVFYVNAGGEYRVSAYESGVMVDRETSRSKTGLGTDYRLR